jgi:L-ascorbate metabolism protein UlaG (beta-lactamase superfamily)
LASDFSSSSAGPATLPQTPSPNEKKAILITWLGHVAFEILSSGGTDLLIDPFLAKNPATPAERKDLARYHPSHILVTHSHGDHFGDAVELAKPSKAKLVSVMMLDALRGLGVVWRGSRSRRST